MLPTQKRTISLLQIPQIPTSLLHQSLSYPTRTSPKKTQFKKMYQFSYRELELATRSFSKETLIGKGSHGCVYRATLENGNLVAVKKTQIHQNNKKLENEIMILSSLQSSHFVNLLGTCNVPSQQNQRLLIMEFMPNGSLHDFLHISQNPPLNWSKRAVIALQIAKAIQLLHRASPPVIHRDIKTANILLDENCNAKLGDFGLAVKATGDTTFPAGTIGYLDPCYTTPAKLSTKNDVFSFGVVLLEIVSCRRAMDVGFEPAFIVDWALPLIEEDRVGEVCDSRIEMGNVEDVIRPMLGIAVRCVDSEEKNRPEMEEVVRELRSVVEHVRYPVWSFVKKRLIGRYGFVRNRRVVKTRKVVCSNQEEGDGGVCDVGCVRVSNGSCGKLLRDHLADDDDEDGDLI